MDSQMLLYIVLWSRVDGELDRFIGQVKMPLSIPSLEIGEPIQLKLPLNSNGIANKKMSL